MDVFVQEKGVYRFGPFRLDASRRTLSRDGAAVKLPDRLFDTLHVLVASHGRVVGRDELLRTVWGGRVVEESNLSQAIFALRKLLQPGAPADGFIVTSPGRGYRFAGPVAFEREPPASEQSAPLPSQPLPPHPLPPHPLPPPRQPPLAPAAPRRLRRWGAAALAAALAAVVAAALLSRRAPGPGADDFTPPPRSVAVLAFDNMTGDPAQAYLADGLAEQLIDSLASIDALRVAARASSFSFRDSNAGVAEMARKLNVGALLQGSLRRAGSHLRVTAQLIDAKTGYALWSKTYEGEQGASGQGDVLAFEADMARAVTASLQVSLLGDDAEKLTLGGTSRADAFDAFLRGRTKMRSPGGDADYRAALADFDAAIALDGKFAQALSYRALALSYMSGTGVIPKHAEERRLFQDALAAADAAVALAPDLGLAHSARGIVLAWGFLDFQGAAAEQAQALALAPGEADIQTGFAYAASAVGRMDEAVQATRRAAELDPMASQAWFELGRMLFLARRYDEAMEAARHAQATAHTAFARLPALLGRIQLMQGDAAAAVRSCAGGASFSQVVTLAIAYDALGRRAEAEAQLSRLRDLVGEDGAYLYAIVYARWGRTEEALRWLETAVQMQDAGLGDLAADPLLDSVRGEAEFKSIARRLGAAT
jgi:TolB-like protein/DNA-binding winged helix-turn-helix (wHTH) protein/Flp pilus assembly protein TadD